MTRNDAKNILTNEDLPSDVALELLEMGRPMGIAIEEIIEKVVEYADADELDIIGRLHFGLIREGGTQMVNGHGASDPETDACFRARIMSHICGPPKPKAHVHTWKTYQGFTDTYDYCTGCDEKKR
jgi:hypothetical protein